MMDGSRFIQIMLVYICQYKAVTCSEFCNANNLLEPLPESVTDHPYDALSGIAGDDCSDVHLTTLLNGLTYWAQDTFFAQLNSGTCNTVNDYQCACLEEVGATVATSIPPNCTDRLTNDNLDVFLHWTNVAQIQICDIANTFTYCSYEFIPIHGGYTEWSEWTNCTCSESDVTSTQYRNRSCTNPVERNPGGLNCTDGGLGEAEETVVCYCPINGDYTEWSEWGSCDGCVGTQGTQERTRNCSNPSPQYGGSNCTEQGFGDASETINCECPEETTAILSETTATFSETTATLSEIAATLSALSSHSSSSSSLGMVIGIVVSLIIIAGTIAVIIIAVIIYKKKKNSASEFNSLVEEKTDVGDSVIVTDFDEQKDGMPPLNYAFLPGNRQPTKINFHLHNNVPSYESNDYGAVNASAKVNSLRDNLADANKTKHSIFDQSVPVNATSKISSFRENDPANVHHEKKLIFNEKSAPKNAASKISTFRDVKHDHTTRSAKDKEMKKNKKTSPTSTGGTTKNDFKNGPALDRGAIQALSKTDNLPRFIQKGMAESGKTQQKPTKPSQPAGPPTNLLKPPMSQTKPESPQLGKATVRKLGKQEKGKQKKDAKSDPKVGRYTPATNTLIRTTGNTEANAAQKYYTYHI